MGIQIYILACMHETVWRWVIQPHKKSRMQEPRHIDKNHSSIRIHSHWTFKLTNQQIRRFPAEQEYRKACRWLQAYHKHIQARKHATSRMSTQSQKHSRVYKTLKKRKHTDIRTHRHSSKQAIIREHAHYYSSVYSRVHLLRHIINQNSYSVLQRA